jgi:hypothetical protein
MDAVDVISLSVTVAQALRGARFGEKLAAAYRALELEPDARDADDPDSVRVVRLVERVGERHAELLAHVLHTAAPVFMNRSGATTAPEPDEEAAMLVSFVNAAIGTDEVIDLFARSPGDDDPNVFGPYSISERRVVRIPPPDAIPEPFYSHPGRTRGLLDCPLVAPILFDIELGPQPWPLQDVCAAFADQYLKIYEQPDAFGIEFHDIADLCIECMYYVPHKGILYPSIGT